MKNYCFLENAELDLLLKDYNSTLNSARKNAILIPIENAHKSCTIDPNILDSAEKRVIARKFNIPENLLNQKRKIILYPSIQNQKCGTYTRRNFFIPARIKTITDQKQKILNSLSFLAHENFEAEAQTALMKKLDTLGLSPQEKRRFFTKYMLQQNLGASSHMPGVLNKEAELAKALRKKYGYKMPVTRSWLQKNMNNHFYDFNDQDIINSAKNSKSFMPSFIFSKQGAKTAAQYGAVVGSGIALGKIAVKYVDEIYKEVSNSDSAQSAYDSCMQLINSDDNILSRKKLLKTSYILDYFKEIVDSNIPNWKELMLIRVKKYKKLLYLCGILTSMTTVYLYDKFR